MLLNDMENKNDCSIDPEEKSAHSKHSLETANTESQPVNRTQIGIKADSGTNVNATTQPQSSTPLESDLIQCYNLLLGDGLHDSSALPYPEVSREQLLLANALRNSSIFGHANRLNLSLLPLSSQLNMNRNILDGTTRGIATDVLADGVDATALQSLYASAACQQHLSLPGLNITNPPLRNFQRENNRYAQRGSEFGDTEKDPSFLALLRTYQQQKATSLLASHCTPPLSRFNNQGIGPSTNTFKSLAAARLQKSESAKSYPLQRELPPDLSMAQYPPSTNHVVADRNPELHSPVDMHMKCDNEVLLDYQILLRKQMEYFAAGPEEVQNVSSSRRRIICIGQVGIRCKHCAKLPPFQRGTAATYYPSSLQSIYQSAQNMTVTHLLRTCEEIDEDTKSQLQTYREGPALVGHGGKKYWAECAKALGIIEKKGEGLRFKTSKDT